MLGIFELFGTIAFAASGAITGLSKKMDILGVATTVIVLRLLAAHYRWSLPKAEIE